MTPTKKHLSALKKQRADPKEDSRDHDRAGPGLSAALDEVQNQRKRERRATRLQLLEGQAVPTPG